MMHRRRRLAAVTVLVAALAAGLAACGSGDPPSDGPTTQPDAGTAAPAQPTGTEAPATGQPAGEAAQLENGRHPVILERVDVAGRTVTFDLVQWFTGDAATKAAAEDGEESPPPNDYYIRNVNPRLRTMPLAADARLTLTRQTLGQGGNATAGVEVDLAGLAAGGREHLFWATAQNGRILRLEEQYLP